MNVSVLKVVVAILGLVLIIMAVFAGLFVLNDKSIPDLFGNVMLMGIAGLLGLLAPSKDAVADKVIDVQGRHEEPQKPL